MSNSDRSSLCIDARMLDSGGIGTYLDNIFYHIKNAPFRISALVNHKQIESRKKYWDKITPILCDAPIYSVKEQWELPRKIPFCDLFWSPHYNIPLSPIRAKKRLTTIHDVYHLAFYHVLKPTEKLYASTVIRAAVSYADKIITDSYFSREELKKYTRVKDTKIHVIYPGVDVRLKDSSECEEDTSDQLPEKFLLFVGNLKPHKNLKGLVEAFLLLYERGFTDLHLVIIGKKEGFKNAENLQSLLKKAASRQNFIHFLGNVSDKILAACYGKAQALILPSFYEGFGFPPIEAMHFDCPVIVSNQGSLPEVCGMAASYVNPNCSVEIANGLQALLQDLPYRKDLIQKGKDQKRKYCWTTSAESHLELINAMVN